MYNLAIWIIMIDWNAFYANGGYYGLNDPGYYDDGNYEDEECEEDDYLNETEDESSED